ncbi:hypothetical protein ACQYZY_28865 [Pseudomonas aeruginosa]|jgi:hypothetical protein|uniref:hypothetical protein n=1 Tax=Pseudomonas aeruginosa TaxID=287 RepID=UPI001A2E9AAD|nr:hypothetical protein [Pseudomonas aeruginosa]MBH4314793.1 hypothetical protein [Pseudomonas aeruginosa]MBH8699137.1 hypothetical protein [Pseudomonas aeruginosa]WBM10964.1 hypothetical protein M1V28_31665 [Pseudomonas aeruginosa]HEK3608702.1 hypothetical protein [Pseudomonas aeruginosa]
MTHRRIEDLRERLFDTIDGLLDKTNPLDIERAKAVAQVGSVIVESAKAEVRALETLGGKAQSGFLQIGRDPQ